MNENDIQAEGETEHERTGQRLSVPYGGKRLLLRGAAVENRPNISRAGTADGSL